MRQICWPRGAGRVIFVVVWAVVAGAAAGADWPMWRCDAGRTGVSAERLPKELHLQWVRKYPALRPAYWQARQERVQFDLGYEPVVAGKTLFVGSNRNDSVTAIDTETGEEKWRFYTDGPVRFAPVVWEGRVYVGSDDGCVYCLGAGDGRVVWKLRAAPSERKVIGNGRLISVWPVRGGPVIADGVIYFAAGVWPFEGVFVCAADARTGKMLWVNDKTGSMYVKHPHEAPSFGGPVPQGYLLVRGDEVVVPSGRAFPAFFDRKTGELTHFDFGFQGHGSCPGGWFVSTNGEGRLCVDPDINQEYHDEGLQIIGQRAAKRKLGEPIQKEVRIGKEMYQIRGGVAEMISVGGREVRFGDELPEIKGRVHTMLAADGKLFVVMRSGEICCLDPAKTTVRRYEIETKPLMSAEAATAKRILQLARATKGHAVMWGVGDGSLLEEVLRESELNVVAVERDEKRVAELRDRLDKAGVYGDRVAVHVGEPTKFGIPPYIANVVVCGNVSEASVGRKGFAEELFRVLRPYGGTAVVELSERQHEQFALACRGLAGARIRREGELTLLVREGALPGAADYVGVENGDQLVAAPLGVLWFGDTFHHHKLYWKGYLTPETGRGLPQTISVIGGVIKYVTLKVPVAANPEGIAYRDYLQQMDKNMEHVDVYTDVYTGRGMEQAEGAAAVAASLRSGPPTARSQPSAVRRNPMTGKLEAREFVKSHGCDLYAVDYGNMLTLRSGTGAFYDQVLESGLVNVSGTRSGCRNSIVPGDGVLCMPSWTGNCTCNYPVFTSLAMVHMPEEYEQWAAWGGVAANAAIERVGINLGAPGDRMVRDGTLWVGYPGAGGPSPRVAVNVSGEKVEWFYRHSVFVNGGQGWPWVVASGVKGAKSIRIEPVVKRVAPVGENFSVRWVGFVRAEVGEKYTFHTRTDHGMRVWVGERLVIDNAKRIKAGRIDESSGSVSLEAGKAYPIRIEYYQAKGKQARLAEVRWSSASMAKELIPARCLLDIDGKAGGLMGVYYGQAGLGGPGVVQKDARVGFNWGDRPPEALVGATRAVELKERAFTVRLYFAEPEDVGVGERIFSVKVQGKEVIRNLDIAKEAGGVRRGIVREVKGVRVKDAMQIDFASATQAPAVICGVEMIAE